MLVAANVTWYAARAGGMIAFALLTVSLLLGLALSGRAQLERWPRFALEDLHRFAGLLAGCFIAVHVSVLLVDDYLPFSVSSLVVPGTAPYRPLATALGVVAAEILLALAVTNALRGRLPYRVWRTMHMLNLAVWVLALAHGLTAGSDSASAWAVGLYAISAASVVGLVTWRVFAPRIARAGASRASLTELFIAPDRSLSRPWSHR